jgi:glucose/mannose-6-phosphate isomerase
MKQLITDFTKQIAQAITIGSSFNATETERGFTNVVISGMGGSGIGGTIAAEVVASEAVIPIVTNNGYAIPAFVDEHTLFIACSYSGNTEETIAATELASKVGAKIVVIVSGGKLLLMAEQNDWDHIIIPGGQPPRASFGFSFPQVLFVLSAFGVITDEFVDQLNSSITLLDAEEEEIQKEAREVTEEVFGKIPVIYAANGFGGVATRFRQQVNENAKMLCWHNVIPEMNHNELVGWRTKNDDLAVIMFRNSNDNPRVQARMDINGVTMGLYTETIIEIWSKGTSNLERAIYLIHLGDWISYFLGEKKGVDIMEVKVIDHLKDELAKLPA